MSPTAAGQPRVTVLWHSTLRRDDSDGYLIKEVWGWYLEEALAPTSGGMIIVASLAPLSAARFEEYRLSHPDLSVVLLNTEPSANKVRRILQNFRDIATAVRSADVIWIFMPAWKGVYGAFVARLLRRPVVSYFGTDWVGMDDAGQVSNAFRQIAQRIVVAFSTRILVADSHQLARYESLRPGRTLRRAPAMPLSVVDTWRRRTYRLQDPPIIQFVGSVDRRKGVDILLEASRILIRDRHYDARIRIVGPVSEIEKENFSQQARSGGIQGYVDFVGYVRNGPELYDLMKTADLLVLPSRSEGFPRVLYEAMAHGLPIVASRVGSIDSIMHDRKNCLLIPPEDPIALADALDLLLQDESLRQDIAEHGYRSLTADLPTSAVEQVAAVMDAIWRKANT